MSIIRTDPQYKLESLLYDQIRKSNRERGKPYGCSFQAGYFQCPNEYNEYALTEIYLPKTKQWGWQCQTCGTFYPEQMKEDAK